MTASQSVPIPHSDPVYEYLAGPRRKSVDTGGLALALRASDTGAETLIGRELHLAFGWGTGTGWGWGGWDDVDAAEGPLYAELLNEMYIHTRDTTDIALFEPFSGVPSQQARNQLIRRLSKWNFEPQNLSEDELIECACLLFEALFKVEGMREDSGVDCDQLRPFICAVRSIYHSQNQYHNFQHAIDVFQAVYSFLVQAECVPPITFLLDGEAPERDDLTLPLPPLMASKQPGAKVWSRKSRKANVVQRVLDNKDLLALCIAAIGHDVGHPGLSNAFMKNARTPLSVVYDDKSALEQMHCALLLQLMRKHGLGHLIATPTELANMAAFSNCHDHNCSTNEFRKLLVQTVLITDMSLHFDWMKSLGQLAKDLEADETAASAKENVKLLICQALIKCGDISNPTRPHAVSEHWSSALLQEWSCQAMLERELGLPVSVVASADEIVQAKGQVGFIDLFTKPLFDTTAAVIPALEVFARQGDINRAQWQQRLEASIAASAEKAGAELKVISPRPNPDSSQDQHYRSVFPLSLPQSLLSPLPTPSPQKVPRSSGWPVETQELPLSDDDESNTPTMPASAPATQRENRAHSSVSSSSSVVASPSPFSPSAADTSSTAASSPSSHPRSIMGDSPMNSSALVSDSQTTPVRAAYNASVRRKKSFHRQSWDLQRNVRSQKDSVPPMPPLPGSRDWAASR